MTCIAAETPFAVEGRPFVKATPQKKRTIGPKRNAPEEPVPSQGESPEFLRALTTALRWRRAPAIAISQRSGALVGSNRTRAGTVLDLERQPPYPIEFGGLAFQLITESLHPHTPAADIPSIVTDMMLRSIVEVGDVKDLCAPATTNFVHLRGPRRSRWPYQFPGGGPVERG